MKTQIRSAGESRTAATMKASVVKVRRSGQELITETRQDGSIAKTVKVKASFTGTPVTEKAVEISHGGMLTKVEPRLVNARTAEDWLTRYSYDKQRRCDLRRVHAYAEAMREGKFSPATQLRFAVLGEERFLLNGQHRLHAVAESNVPTVFDVVEHTVKDMNQVAELYYREDRQRPRRFSDLIRVTELPELTNLSATNIGKVGSAIKLIEGDFTRALSASGMMFSDDEVREKLEDWVEPAQKFFALTAGSQTIIRRRIEMVPVIAVALTTLKYVRPRYAAKAAEFWSGAAHNDGLKRGDPRKTLVEFLLSTGLAGGSSGTAARLSSIGHMTRAVAACWNAWIGGRDLAFVKIHKEHLNAPIKLTGTTWKRDKPSDDQEDDE